MPSTPFFIPVSASLISLYPNEERAPTHCRGLHANAPRKPRKSMPRALTRVRSILKRAMSASYPEPDVVAMSNYSVYFLRQNLHLDTNCSVYSLTLGLIRYQDYTSGGWLQNITKFLPAYYVTNCLIPDLWAQIASQNVSLTDIASWLEEYRQNPYNEADNGDSFVALLFMLVGLCVSCWMLSLLFLLLPKNKQKPVLTQLAMLFYLVYLTVIFSQVARITELEYYADSLDMIRILTTMADVRYAVLALILTVLTQTAYLQLFIRLTRKHWRAANCAVVALLIIATLISGAFFVPLLRDPYKYATHSTTAPDLVFMGIQAIFMLWFAGCLGHYTLYGTATPPKQVSYLRKLLPLAILTWIFVITYVVLLLLLTTYWRTDWRNNSWIAFIPNLLCMYILTASWEWYYSIRHLELQLEIVDMLGRRISLEDVMDFDNDEKVRRTAIRGRFASVWDFLWGRKFNSQESKHGEMSDTSSTPVVVDCGEARVTHGVSRDDESSEYEVQYMDTDSWGNSDNHEMGTRGFHGAEGLSSVNEIHEDTCSNHSPGERNVVQGTSRDTQVPNHIVVNSTHDEPRDELPPFRPHPGFSRDDYWDEK